MKEVSSNGIKLNHNKGGVCILYSIQKEIEMLESGLVCMEEELKNLPCGSLRCTSSNGSHQYYVDGNYISKKQIERIRGLTQREYYEKLEPIIKRRLKMLHQLEQSYISCEIENCYEELCAARKSLVMPFCETVEDKVRKFLNEEYEPGVFDENNVTEFFTLRGERVRSKSEVLISEHLNHYGVPYRYEKPLDLLDWNKVVTCRPDFTVINKRTGKILIYEHLGRMDDENYVAANMHKLDLYEKNGYLLGENLIVTHETSKSPLNVKVLDSYIKTYFI